MRRRIVATLLACTTVAVVLLLVPAARAVRDHERDAQVLELQRDAARAAAELAGADPTSTPIPTSTLEHRSARYDGQGDLLDGDGPPRLERQLRGALALRASAADVGDESVVAIPVVARDGVASLVLRVSEPRAESDAATRRAVVGIGVAALLALGIAGGAGWLLVVRTTRPLEELREVAHRFGDGDFAVAPAPSGLPEIDEVRAALAGAAGRISTLLERERRFTSDASHQLRTPVTAMRVAIEGEQLAPRADRQLLTAELLAELDTLERTVSTLLELARGEVPVTSPVPVSERLRACGDRWRRRTEAAGRTLVVDATCDATVRVAASALDHVLDVLVDNALAHGHGTITVGAARRAEATVVSVADEGACAADPTTMFSRRDPAATGRGIGLALARTLAEAEGGRLHLASRRPTCFDVTFPAGPP